MANDQLMPFVKKVQTENSLFLIHPGSEKINIYDNALGILFHLRNGQTKEASKIIASLEAVQASDGSLPFNIRIQDLSKKTLPKKNLVRSGALAWVGYSVVQYLNHKKDVPHKKEALALSHGIARYLQENQLENLVRGGFGEIKYSIDNGVAREELLEKQITWISTEHNIDAYFFFKSFAKLTNNKEHLQTADKIKKALVTKLWSPEDNQFHQGLNDGVLNKSLALDGASWGALFLIDCGETKKAALAVNEIERKYESKYKDIKGHKPYFSETLVPPDLIALFKKDFPVNSWKQVEGVWTEGSAGVALAYLRLGQKEKAQKTLTALKPLMEEDHSFPDFTRSIPYTFENKPSTAGTLWYWLVDAELKSPAHDQILWKSM